MRMLAMALALFAATVPAKSAEIDALISTAIKSATDELLPPFERTNGYAIHAIYGPSGALIPHLERGETVDILLTDGAAIDGLIKQGKVLPGRIDFARTGIGICVRKGAPRPDVSTPEAFRHAMLEAKSIGYATPAGGSITGPHIQSVFGRLGIADQMMAKTKFAAGGPNGRVSVLVSSGEAEIGLQQVSELMSNSDVEVIGMLPADLQQTTIYSAGIAAGARDGEGARLLIKALTTPVAAWLFKAKGLDLQ
jgi:molybdate transport system substrate-binding protein